MKNIGILFPGEMGGAFGKKLIEGGFNVFTCTAGRSERTHLIAQSSGISLKEEIIDVIEASDIVFSVVLPGKALSIAEEFVDCVHNKRRKPIYVDCNSVSPATTKKIASIVNQSGAHFVDGVFIGSANLFETKTILYFSGRGGEDLARILSSAVRVIHLGDDIGEASAFKMCFGGFNKGLIALFLEIVCASGKTSNRLELIERLEEFYPETIKTVHRLLPSYPKHVKRRVLEIGELIKYFDELEQKHAVEDGVRSVLQDMSDLFANNYNDDITLETLDFEEIIECCIRNDMLSSIRTN